MTSAATNAILYHGEPNGPSLVVLAALAESGLDIEARHIDLLAGERYEIPGIEEPLTLDHSVEGEGPVLVADGEAMTDSVFLAQYLDEAAGGCGLQPADPYTHWQMMMWCRQTTERLAPAVAYLGNIAFSQAKLAQMDQPAFDRIVGRIESADLRERWQDLRDEKVDSAKFSDSKTKVAEFIERVDNQLGDGREWLMGNFSIADLVTFAWLRPVAELDAKASFAGMELCSAWMARVEGRPAIQAAFDRASAGNPLHSFAPGPEINRWG